MRVTLCVPSGAVNPKLRPCFSSGHPSNLPVAALQGGASLATSLRGQKGHGQDHGVVGQIMVTWTFAKSSELVFGLSLRWLKTLFVVIKDHIRHRLVSKSDLTRGLYTNGSPGIGHVGNIMLI